MIDYLRISKHDAEGILLSIELIKGNMDMAAEKKLELLIDEILSIDAFKPLLIEKSEKST